MSDQDQPKIHIDADWKKQAQAEKQRLAEQARQSRAAGAESAAGAAGVASAAGAPGMGGGAGAGAGAAAAAGAAGQRQGRGEMPPANFRTLVSSTVTQAMFALGMIPDPETGRRVAMLDMARHHIDMLGVVEEKTKGNLDDEESKLLATSLYELRMNYVQLSQQVIAQQTGGDEAEAAGGGSGGGNPIISA